MDLLGSLPWRALAEWVQYYKQSQTLAAALMHSAFNTANALGAWLGGAAMAAGFGWASIGWVGGVLAVAGRVVFAASVCQENITVSNPRPPNAIPTSLID